MPWEYRIEKIKTSGMVVPNIDTLTAEDLNLRGKDDWELISTIPMNRGGGILEAVYLIFKRYTAEYAPGDRRLFKAARATSDSVARFPEGPSLTSGIVARFLEGSSLTPGATPTADSLLAYRKKRVAGEDLWHCCTNCSEWPQSGYVQISQTPAAAESVCPECLDKQEKGECSSQP